MESRISEDTRARIAAAWPDICARIASAELVSVAIGAHGFSRKMVSAYILADPEAKREWYEARESSADAFMDKALDIANSPTADSSHARTAIDTYKWAARIRNPRLYGDRASVDVNVRTVDLTQIINAANARIAAQAGARVLEGACVRLSDLT